MSVYIGNLSYDVTQDDLKQVFEDYGTVARVSLPMDRETNRPRGFAFVDMSSKEEEAAAIEALNEAEWLGRTLRVNEVEYGFVSFSMSESANRRRGWQFRDS